MSLQCGPHQLTSSSDHSERGDEECAYPVYWWGYRRMACLPIILRCLCLTEGGHKLDGPYQSTTAVLPQRAAKVARWLLAHGDSLPLQCDPYW